VKRHLTGRAHLTSLTGTPLARLNRVRWGASNNGARGRVIDRCLLCAEAIYEGQETVRFFGLDVHVPCYRSETEPARPAIKHEPPLAA